MTSRILTAVVVGVFAVGMATETRAQQGTATVRKPRKGSLTSASRVSASPGVESGTVSQGSTPGSRDPFDSAAEKLKPSASKGKGESGSDSEENAPAKLEKATFGAGCFWHVESAFEWLPGVKSAVSGYAGGSVPNPDYELVHAGYTGHAEVVQVTYDPSVISYEQLLKVFWSHHDPTQLNRQGPDVGTQYRSVIFYHTPTQREAALKSYRATDRRAGLPGSDRDPAPADAGVLSRRGLPPELLRRQAGRSRRAQPSSPAGCGSRTRRQ